MSDTKKVFQIIDFSFLHHILCDWETYLSTESVLSPQSGHLEIFVQTETMVSKTIYI